MTVKRKLIAGLAACLLSTGAGAFVAATPAQAALGNCPNWSSKGFCLYDGYISGSSDFYPGNSDRNTCFPNFLGLAYNSVWNATPTRWYLFHTTTCLGSHAEIAPDYAGALPAGYDNGSTHAVMRTSRTS
jgi:hypothetical protein